MNMILSLKCSNAHFRSFNRFWISSKRPNVVIPGNICHSNSVGVPSIRFISSKWLFSEHQMIFVQGLNKIVSHFPRRRRLWPWCTDQLCRHSRQLFGINCVYSRGLCFRRINFPISLALSPGCLHILFSGLCQWFLSDHWSVFLFLWKTVPLFSKDNSFTNLKFLSWSCPRWTAAWRVAFRHMLTSSSINFPDNLSYGEDILEWSGQTFRSAFGLSLQAESLEPHGSPQLFCGQPVFQSLLENYRWLLFCSDKFPRGLVNRRAKVCILHSSLRTRRCDRFRISHPAFKFPRCCENLRTSGCNQTFRGSKKSRNEWRQFRRCTSWLCHDPVLFFLFLHPFRHRVGAAGQNEILSATEKAEMATR